MAHLKANVKRATLRSLQIASAGAGNLADCLQQYQSFLFTKLKPGQQLSGGSGSGHSYAFQSIGPMQQGELIEWFDLSEELLTIYADALTTLAAASPPVAAQPDGSTDATILATMLADDRMQTVNDAQTDVSTLRFGSFGPTR